MQTFEQLSKQFLLSSHATEVLLWKSHHTNRFLWIYWANLSNLVDACLESDHIKAKCFIRDADSIRPAFIALQTKMKAKSQFPHYITVMCIGTHGGW